MDDVAKYLLMIMLIILPNGHKFMVLPSGLKLRIDEVPSPIYVGDYVKGVSGSTYMVFYSGGKHVFVNQRDADELKKYGNN